MGRFYVPVKVLTYKGTIDDMIENINISTKYVKKIS